MPPILIGTLKGKPRMSRLTAQDADVWNCMIAFKIVIETFLDAWQPIRMACERHGRDPQTLSRGATVAGNFTSGPYDIVPTSVPFSGPSQ